MTEVSRKPRWRRFARYLLLAMAVGVLILAGLAWYITTDSFQAMVRRSLVAQLEQVTGGRAELGSFHVIPFRFRVEVRDLTIHGLEAATEAPYVHVNRLIVSLKLISVFGAEFGFSSVIVDHPAVHILLYPDGSTNQPGPKPRPSSTENSIERLFAISIARLEVRHGNLLWNDRLIPMDFSVNDVSADMSYSLLHGRYESNLLLGKVDTKFDGYRPFSWTAETHLSLGRNQVEFRTLRATSGRSHLEASGSLRDFRQLNLEGTYDATLDVAEIAAVARRSEARHGSLRAVGRGLWSLRDFSTSAQLTLSDLDWKDSMVSLHDADLSAQVTATPLRLSLSHMQGRTLGGSIAGDIEISRWQSQQTPGRTGRSRSQEQQKGSIRLHYKDVSVSAVADMLSTPELPFRKLGLGGKADGSVEARWLGSPRFWEADLAVDISAPANLSSTQLPLSGRARASYSAPREELEIAELTASTRSTQIRASGALASSAALKVTAVTTDLNEWQPILTTFHAGRIPVVLHGRASFDGNALGKLSHVILAGNLQAQNFEFVVPPTARTPERRLHWDSLNSAIQLSSTNFIARNGELQNGVTHISFDLNMGLHHGRFTEQSPFTTRLDVRQTDLSALLALAGYDYPIHGTTDFHFVGEGTRAHPQGQGRLLLSNATFRGEPIKKFAANIRLGPAELQCEDIHLAYYDAELTGAAAYHFNTRESHLDLTGSNFDLTRIPQLTASRFQVEGRADFRLQAAGTMEQPQLNATVHLRDLVLDRERAGNFTVAATTEGEQLRISGHSQFDQAELTVDGAAHLRGDWPATINFHFARLDVDSLLQAYFRGTLTGHSTVAGNLKLQGPLRHPSRLTITGDLDGVVLNVQDLELRNQGPIRFLASDQFLRFDQFHLTGQGTDLTGSGTIHLSGARELDLKAHGQVNLRLIESFNHDFNSSGVVTVDLTVAGTFSSPTAQGRLQVTNGAISYIDLPSGLSDMNGSLTFNQDRAQIETLTARTGGGLVTLGGFATLHSGRLTFDLSVHGEGVRLRYPPGISSTANADLRFTGTSDASALSGDITVTRLSMTPGFDFGAYLARNAQSTTLPQTNPLLNRIHLDVHITTTPELQMQTAVVRLSGDADLRLRGTAGKPALLGRADITEGDVYFNGTKYHMERGDVTFINPATIQPVVDLQMTTRVRDYDITVSLNGDPSKLNLNYRSEPPLPEADIVALLALGRTREESAQLQQSGQSAFSQEASNAILTEALNAAVSNRVQRLFGGSRIKIDPQGVNTETSAARGPQVTIEQQVTNALTLTYSTNVSQTSQQIIQLEYNVSRNVSIVAVRDQNGVVSFDVRVRQRKK